MHRKSTSRRPQSGIPGLEHLALAFGIALLILASLSKVSLAASSAGENALDNLAATLQPGQWGVLTTNGLNNALLHDPTIPDSILNYSPEAKWDSVTKQFLFIGGGHPGSVGKMIAYDADTNSWRTINKPFNFGYHQWMREAISESRREFYVLLGTGAVWKWNIGTEVWNQFVTAPNGSGYYENENIEYFPEIDSLVIPQSRNPGSLKLYNMATGIWSSPGTFQTGIVQDFGVYNPVKKEVLFGGGQAEPTVYNHIYRLNRNSAVTTMQDSPIHTGVMNTYIVPDPVTGNYLVFGADRVFRVYDSATDSWTIVPRGAPELYSAQFGESTAANRANGCASAHVSNYGVVMFLCANSYYAAEATGKVLIYKHSSTPPPPPPGTMKLSFPAAIEVR